MAAQVFLDPGYHGNACRMPCGRGIRRDKGRACLFVRRVEREKKPWSERKHKKEKTPTKNTASNTHLSKKTQSTHHMSM